MKIKDEYKWYISMLLENDIREYISSAEERLIELQNNWIKYNEKFSNQYNDVNILLSKELRKEELKIEIAKKLLQEYENCKEEI